MDRKQWVRTKYGSYECPHCHARNTHKGINGEPEALVCENCWEVSLKPAPLYPAQVATSDG